VAGVYTIVGWLILQVIAVVTPALKLPDWVDSFFAVTIIAGFPLSMLLAWAFEMTPEGVKRTEAVSPEESIRAQTGRKLEYAIIAGLFLVGGLIITDRFWPSDRQIPRTASVENGSNTPARQTAIIEKSIAVLPFADLTPTQDQDYFSDGIAEEILNALTNIDDLRVAGRTSSFVFKNRNERNLPEIAETLNVAYLLEGSVRKQDDRVRITATLIGPQGFQKWSETYVGSVEDVFDLQEDIAQAIAAELQIFMDTRSPTRLADTLTSNTESYDTFLKGRDLYRSSIKQEDILQTLEYLETAVKLDPDFARAWALLGQASLQAPANVASLNATDYIAKAEAASRKAIDLDPSLPFPYAVLGSISSIRRDQLGAMDWFEKALDLDPKNTYALGNTGLVFAQMGLAGEAVKYFSEAVQFEPNRPSYKAYLAIAKRNLGEFDLSNEWAQKAVDMGYFISYDTLAWNAYSQGDPDKAVEYMMSLYHAGGAQLSPDFQSQALWESSSRAYFKDSQKDSDLIRSLFETQFASPDAEVDGVTTAVFARHGMYEKFFKYVHDARGNAVALMGIWDNNPNSVKLRNHEGFKSFAQSSGMIDFWRKYGWPEKCQLVSENEEIGIVFNCD